MSSSSESNPELIVVTQEPEATPEPPERSESIEQPGKVMRIGTMIKQLLEEVREAPLDERSRVRLAEIYETSIKELSDGLSPDLQDELSRLVSPLDDKTAPSEAELRIVQAQLVGWLEGIFHGIQATLFAQQAVREQMTQGRRALPSAPGQTAPGESSEESRPGTYL